MATARRATAADLDDIVAMGRALHEESPRYRGMQFDAEKVRVLALNLMQSDGAAVFVAQAGDEVIGMTALVAADRWFGTDRYVTDLTMYLKPEHRGNGAFARLVQAMEGWAREQGAQEIDIGVSTDIGTERTVRAYERMGFTLSPTRVAMKKLHHGN